MSASDHPMPLKYLNNALFKRARLIDPSQNLDAVGDLLVMNGRIQGIQTESGLGIGHAEPPQSFDIVELSQDLAGKILCPAFVDIGCSLPEPGFEQKGTFETELAAALAGGYGHLAMLPTTSPVADSPAVINLIAGRAKVQPAVSVLPMGALTRGLEGQLLSDMFALKAAGCVALTQAYQPIQDERVLLNALNYAKTHELTLCLYAQSPALAQAGCVHEGVMAARLGLPGIAACAETVALARDLLLVESAAVRAHVSRVSTARGVELIHDAQQRGLPVTADVSIQNLVYTDAAIDGFNAQFHLCPPLRSASDRQALIQGLKAGVLSAISSAHTPHECAAKLAPFEATQPGMSSLETQVHWANQLVGAGALSWSEWVRGMCGGAQALNLSQPSLAVGAPASFNVIDPQLSWSLDEKALYSRGKNTPLLGETLTGKVLFQVRGIL